MYEKVDIYLFDHNTTTGTKLVSDIELSVGVVALKLDAGLFPESLPVNRSCHILFTRAYNDLDGTHQTLNSSTFFLIRTKQSVSGTMVPMPLPTSIITTASSAVLSTTTSSTSTRPTGLPAPVSSENTLPTNVPDVPPHHANALSPLVIGLISAGCAALLLAMVALGLLFRARRRHSGNTSYFKSLQDHPSSPTEPASKSSIFEHGDANGSFVGPTFGGTTGRNSSNTARSGEPMLKSGSLFSGYNSQSTVSVPVPLIDRKHSALQKEDDQESAAEQVPMVVVEEYDSRTPSTVTQTTTTSTTPATRASLDNRSTHKVEPVLTAGDAALIAETFRKSMRRPRWDDSEDEQDEARRAANELLRKELSEEGVDVRRGVQRRVTIQDRVDRAHRSSVAPPLAEVADEN
ncbi:hypothetical protein BGZ94_007113 [Podila epigama]|nr:hypothetical protein BGZ94_007113 [Podila epigama]